MTTQGPGAIKVFICYAKKDREFAFRLYADLQHAGVKPWLDEKDLLPGQDWKRAIKRAMKESSYVLALLSPNSISQTGYVQKELKEALDLLDLRSSSKIFIIPARIEDCEPDDERLQNLHWVDLFEDYAEGFQKILTAVLSPQPSNSSVESSTPFTQKQKWLKQRHKLGGQQKTKQFMETSKVIFGMLKQMLTKPLGKDWQQSGKKTKQTLLRSEPLMVLSEEALEVFDLQAQNVSWGTAWRPVEYIRNQFEDQGNTVLDHATRLVWQKSGSDNCITYEQAQKYIKTLNRERFEGYDDWRLPTIPELMSLLESERQTNGLYINPIFDETQRWCWSADPGDRSPGSAWVVGFRYGEVDSPHLVYYVRAVRSR